MRQANEAARQRQHHALGHELADQPPAARVAGTPQVTMFDYEFAAGMHHLNGRLASRVLVPALRPFLSGPRSPPHTSTVTLPLAAPAIGAGLVLAWARALGEFGATILFAGNMASRILGLVREMVIAYFFGASGQVSAFRVASQVPTLLYDFLVGGMLSAALVPVLSDYLSTRTRAEFARLAGTLLAVFSVVLAFIVLILELAAPYLAQLLAGGFANFDATLLPLTVRLIRLVSPAVWLFSMAGVVTVPRAPKISLRQIEFLPLSSCTCHPGR